MKHVIKKSKKKDSDFLVMELEKLFNGATERHGALTSWNGYGGDMDGVHTGYLDINGDDIPMNREDAWLCSYVFDKMPEIIKRLKGREARGRKRTTYSSTQATNCAVCGEHKHTPLRIDHMGGYVCLTCIDAELHR